MIAYVVKRMEMKILNEVEMNVWRSLSGAALCQMDACCYYAVLIDRRSHLIHYV